MEHREVDDYLRRFTWWRRWSWYCLDHPLAYWIQETVESVILFILYMSTILLAVAMVAIVFDILPYIFQLFPYDPTS